MGIKQIFKKQGGWKLIRQYIKGGAFLTAVGEFVLLGKSRTSLEILRLATQFKTKKKLAKKYKKKLVEFDQSYDEGLTHKSSDKVWICWFQGMEEAPHIVKRCYESVCKNLNDREIVLLTNENLMDYVDFPDYIIDKWKKGIITNTHMTDLLRLELLIRHGGIWLDATVFCSGSEIPEYFFDSELFFFQCLKPGRDGHASYISSWLMSAQTNNKLLMATRYLCYEYWKANNEMWDYFLLHDFMSIVLDYYPKEWSKIVPRDNATPHELLLRLFEPYDDRILKAIFAQTPFHKLTYKFDKKQSEIKQTYYSELFGD